jgi:hypothetical protein
METHKSYVTVLQLALATAFLLAAATLSHASTVWTGPNIGFYHSFLGAKDQITPIVILTRTNTHGLYNFANEAGAGIGSPKGTKWAIGTLSQFTNNLIPPSSFQNCPLESGHAPPGYIGTTFVVHLITNDIYLELTLTNWGGALEAPMQQTFGYIRSTAPPAAPPTVSITNPAGGTVLAEPANVTVQASAGNGSGGVTNVQFRVDANIFANKSSPPFTAATNNLAAGNYALIAIASDSGGLKATNSVAITVVTPVPLVLASAMTTSATSFQFSYAADIGLSYVVQQATDLGSGSWVSIVTNVAASNPVVFVDVQATNNPAFYRVGRMPNP